MTFCMESYAQDREALSKYLVSHVETVLKKPRSFIRYPFIDPGSVYDGNVWDWDTYWSVYSLFGLRDLFSEDLNARILIHAEGNVRNFFDHQQPDGYIPMMIEVAKWPEPYLVMRHKEGVRMNMHKPFLASQAALICRRKGNWDWMREYVEPLERYFAYYETYRNENCGLYVWHGGPALLYQQRGAAFYPAGRPGKGRLRRMDGACAGVRAGLPPRRRNGLVKTRTFCTFPVLFSKTVLYPIDIARQRPYNMSKATEPRLIQCVPLDPLPFCALPGFSFVQIN